jgi:hypothetical protein
VSQWNFNLFFLRAATAFDIFGTDYAGEVVTCGTNTHFHQYPFSILWQEFLDVSHITLLC